MTHDASNQQLQRVLASMDERLDLLTKEIESLPHRLLKMLQGHAGYDSIDLAKVDMSNLNQCNPIQQDDSQTETTKTSSDVPMNTIVDSAELLPAPVNSDCMVVAPMRTSADTDLAHVLNELHLCPSLHTTYMNIPDDSNMPMVIPTAVTETPEDVANLLLLSNCPGPSTTQSASVLQLQDAADVVHTEQVDHVDVIAFTAQPKDIPNSPPAEPSSPTDFLLHISQHSSMLFQCTDGHHIDETTEAGPTETYIASISEKESIVKSKPSDNEQEEQDPSVRKSTENSTEASIPSKVECIVLPQESSPSDISDRLYAKKRIESSPSDNQIANDVDAHNTCDDQSLGESSSAFREDKEVMHEIEREPSDCEVIPIEKADTVAILTSETKELSPSTRGKRRRIIEEPESEMEPSRRRLRQPLSIPLVPVVMYKWADGSMHRAPEGWKCPDAPCREMWCFWFRGDEVHQVGPFRFLKGSDISDVVSRHLLARFRAVMDQLIKTAIDHLLTDSYERLAHIPAAALLAVFDASFDILMGKTAQGTLTRQGFQHIRPVDLASYMCSTVYDIMAAAKTRRPR
ncbi:unnamed protein product [Aphanomyces euteiches]